MAWTVETAPVEMVSTAITAATPKPRRGVSAATTRPSPAKSTDSTATDATPCPNHLVWSAKSNFASRAPTYITRSGVTVRMNRADAMAAYLATT